MSTERCISVPRISASALGEFMVAPPRRRLDILERAKYPMPPNDDLGPARLVLADHLAGSLDRAGIMARAESLGTSSTREGRLCAEALLRFLDLPPLDFRGMTPAPFDVREHLDVRGVQVCVEPDVVLEGVGSDGRPTMGAIKLLFLERQPGQPCHELVHEYVSAVLHELVSEHVRAATEGRVGGVMSEACLVVDPVSMIVHPNARGFRRRWRDVLAGCDEIRRMWPTV